MIIDAGGGTVDAITYKVKEQYPLRLQELVEPDGTFWATRHSWVLY